MQLLHLKHNIFKLLNILRQYLPSTTYSQGRIIKSYCSKAEITNLLVYGCVVKLQLVILALHPVKKAQRINIRWSKKYHQQTERWLIQLLNQPTETELQTPAINSEILSLIDLEAIPEVKL